MPRTLVLENKAWSPVPREGDRHKTSATETTPPTDSLDHSSKHYYLGVARDSDSSDGLLRAKAKPRARTDPSTNGSNTTATCDDTQDEGTLIVPQDAEKTTTPT